MYHDGETLSISGIVIGNKEEKAESKVEIKG